MIYLDCAATALQKPPEVARAMTAALGQCASPGRGSYPASARAAEVAFRCREALAQLLGADSPEQVVFTSNATHALNIAIRSLVQPGDTVVVSGYEHNAVTRTLASIPEVAVRVAVGGLFDQAGDLEAFSRLICRDTKAVVCTHVSNVFGYILPIDGIAALCRERGVPLIVDASQSAGILPVSAKRWGAAYVGLPGHKGLCGPQGTGVLVCGGGQTPVPLLAGGTGSESLNQKMPDFLPDRLEAGTHNMPGIAGLLAGVQFTRRKGTDAILCHERRLSDRMAGALSRIPGVRVIRPQEADRRTGVLSFLAQGQDCEVLGASLTARGISLRTGLHCAPLAHRTAGTLETGTLRASVSPFNTPGEVDDLAVALAGCLEK
ncbi:MAG: aminotransferase class V-fold PLP-dependent enzyme [Clostridiales bacterium]|nr:aminotransferase class V-fold PLP-dependent enzyme [Clostridiales bacterium]